MKCLLLDLNLRGTLRDGVNLCFPKQIAYICKKVTVINARFSFLWISLVKVTQKKKSEISLATKKTML